MLNAAQVLPASPAEPEADVFPLRERLRFRDSFGLALLELRARSDPFRELPKGPWALFIAIAVHWQGNAEAWPRQETLARFSGWSTRAVRDQADALERSGFIRVRRERRFDGSERIFYAPGLVTLTALADFVERFPRERAKPLSPEPPRAASTRSPTIVHPAEGASAALPEAVSMEHRDQDQIELSSSSEARGPTLASKRAQHEPRIEIGREDEEIACRALGERMARKHPTLPAPRWFDSTEIATVAACTAALEGDLEAKMLAQCDAIAGAFTASKNGPPSVRFIWEKLDHFFDHVERGRRQRVNQDQAQQRTSQFNARERRMHVEAPTPMPDQVRAELERLFGPGWTKTHVPRTHNVGLPAACSSIP